MSFELGFLAGILSTFAVIILGLLTVALAPIPAYSLECVCCKRTLLPERENGKTWPGIVVASRRLAHVLTPTHRRNAKLHKSKRADQ
ncbi:hypothetical protein [Bifidobacterium callitrichidarum]|uniref:Uncharacterized protein n=1 Tax=Bifidobacterium callitrichidarum TaxID=2052941 RepID=A0A2U2N8S6_9BIFI|nr:hypothetical protein [Bifidobacterium callitrichidarum]PWG65586.1 hypothetical protein DF196_06530 [Bifidobacterium callitrichidarum]